MKDLRLNGEPDFPDLPPSYDRRRRERVELAIPLRIFSPGLLEAKSSLGTCTGLSEGGVSFDCDADLNLGDIVILEFRQKGETAYRCHARLAYRIEDRYGAYFLTGQ
jgi:hypothetical protein